MSLRATVDAGRIASRASNGIRHASVSAAPADRKTRGQMRKEHGSSIYIYSHLQTKQVVYSLTPALKNNHALRQLPYNGKKTVPAALRKDLWHPMAHVQFSASVADSPQLGLSTFQKLREYRHLHETLWPEEEMKGLSRKQRGRKLCDQRANSVADLAAALGKVLPGGTAKEEAGASEKEALAVVKWADILDAEFAESWPKSVVHDTWETLRNNRKPPVYDEESAEGVGAAKKSQGVAVL